MTVGNVEQTPSNSTAPATTALPNQHRVATNFNSQIAEEQSNNMSRVDGSSTMCYQTQTVPQFLHETLTQKLIAIQQKSHHHMSQHSPINDHLHHPQIHDNSPPTIAIQPSIMQHQQIMSKHYPHISLNHNQRMMQPLNINTQQNTYHQQFYHQINWNQQLTHYQHQ